MNKRVIKTSLITISILLILSAVKYFANAIYNDPVQISGDLINYINLNGLVEYELLSSKYRNSISKEEYYSLDEKALYKKINSISETFVRPQNPRGSTDQWKTPPYFGGEHVADIDYETNWLFSNPKVVYWYIFINDNLEMTGKRTDVESEWLENISYVDETLSVAVKSKDFQEGDIADRKQLIE